MEQTIQKKKSEIVQDRCIKAVLSSLKIGLIGFGGGSILIPVIEKEVVLNQNIISEDELNKDIVVASITPGALPVEIASSVGRRAAGIKGMTLAAMAMAFPGAFLMVMILSLIAGTSEEMLRQIQYIAIGINCFIAFLLTKYVYGTVKVCKEEKRQGIGSLIISLVVIVTCGKELYGVLGIERAPIFDVSTLNVLCITFFVIFYIQGERNRKKICIASVLSLTYLLCVGKSGIISSNIIKNVTTVGMIYLSAYGVIRSLKSQKIRIEWPYKLMAKETVACFAIIFLGSLPALLVVDGTFSYIAKAMGSTLLSFGGGDAYLTIAESMFVNPDMLSGEQFYAHLVPVANALPGSILCKMLSGIGYCIGYNQTGTMMGGYIVGIAGFATSVMMSCYVFTMVSHIYESLENIHILELLKKWIRTIISGLLVSVALSMVLVNIEVSTTYGLDVGKVMLFSGGIYLLNCMASKVKCHHMILVIMSGTAMTLYLNWI